jgi:hypothetical protein
VAYEQWDGTLKHLHHFVADAEAAGATEVNIDGGFDGAESKADLDDGIYEPWAAEYAVTLWTQDEADDNEAQKGAALNPVPEWAINTTMTPFPAPRPPLPRPGDRWNGGIVLESANTHDGPLVLLKRGIAVSGCPYAVYLDGQQLHSAETLEEAARIARF